MVEGIEMGLGEVIRELRLQRGWSQEELARRAKVSTSYIGHLERGARKGASWAVIVKLARAFGIPEEEFFRMISRGEPQSSPRSFTQAFQELELLLPVAIPIVAEGSAGDEGIIVDYAYWARPKAAGKNILGVLVRGDCLEPDFKDGDIAFADTDLSPQNGDFVVCLIDGKLAIKRYREAGGKVWLENKYGRIEIGDNVVIQGVVIEKSVKMR